MADGIQFTKADLEGLGLRKDIVEAVFQDVNMQTVEIDRIYQIGINLENLISHYIKLNQTGGYSKVKRATKENKERVSNIMFIGTQFVFELRSFLLKDEIQFWLGGMYTDDTGTTQLAERQLDQKTMLQNIRASLSSKAMLLKGHLEMFEKENILIDHQHDLNAIWNYLLAASDTTDFVYQPGQHGDLIINNRDYFMNPNLDTNMYIKYSGAKHMVTQYYLQNGSLEYFNRGWMWEWFRGLSVIDERITEIENAIYSSEHPIGLIFQGRDNIMGIKGGDFVIGSGQGSAQAKYGNSQIITFTSVIKTIKQINTILVGFKVAYPNETRNFANQLYDLFIDESLASSLTMSANQTIDYILENLNRFVSV